MKIGLVLEGGGDREECTQQVYLDFLIKIKIIVQIILLGCVSRLNKSAVLMFSWQKVKRNENKYKTAYP